MLMAYTSPVGARIRAAACRSFSSRHESLRNFYWKIWACRCQTQQSHYRRSLTRQPQHNNMRQSLPIEWLEDGAAVISANDHSSPEESAMVQRAIVAGRAELTQWREA